MGMIWCSFSPLIDRHGDPHRRALAGVRADPRGRRRARRPRRRSSGEPCRLGPTAAVGSRRLRDRNPSTFIIGPTRGRRPSGRAGTARPELRSPGRRALGARGGPPRTPAKPCDGIPVPVDQRGKEHHIFHPRKLGQKLHRAVRMGARAFTPAGPQEGKTAPTERPAALSLTTADGRLGRRPAS